MHRPLEAVRSTTNATSPPGDPQTREIGPVIDGGPPTEYLTRDSILELLSDDEISKVSAAEDHRMIEHDDYIDLQEIERGVQQANGAIATMGTALPRKSVRPETWDRIVALLARVHPPESGAEV